MRLIINKFFILIFLFFTFIYSNAAIARGQFFVGIDAIYNKLSFKKDYGENIFSKKLTPGLNGFIGCMFNNHFGTEVGFEIEKTSKRTTTIPSKEIVLGAAIPVGLKSMSFKTKFNQKYPYLGIISKFNLTTNNLISFFAGISRATIKANYNIFQQDIPGFGPEPENITEIFSKTRFIPMLKAAIEHNINNQLAIKLFANWKNTSKFKLEDKSPDPYPYDTIKLKNSFNFGIGITYYI
jgi:hypothetical protein